MEIRAAAVSRQRITRMNAGKDAGFLYLLLTEKLTSKNVRPEPTWYAAVRLAIHCYTILTQTIFELNIGTPFIPA